MKARHFPYFAMAAIAFGGAGWLLADHLYWESLPSAMLIAAPGGFLAAAAIGIGLDGCFPRVKIGDRGTIALLVALTLLLPGSVVWKNRAFPPSAQEMELIGLLGLPADSLEARAIITDLGNRGAAASYAIPALRKIASDPTHHCQDHAIWALQKITGHELSHSERFWLRDAPWVVPTVFLVLLVIAPFYVPVIGALFGRHIRSS